MDNLFDLNGEVVVITGGTGTVGRAFAKALLCAGAKVALLSRGRTGSPPDILKELGAASVDCGKDVVAFFSADVTDKPSVARALEEIVAAFGRPSVLVNAAGGNRGKSSFIDADSAQFEEVLKLNLLGGLVIPTQVFADYWIKNGIKGAVINVASAASFVPLSGVWAYDAAKAGVRNLTMAAAKEFAPHGIRVNAIAPGFFLGHQNRDILYDDFASGKLSARGIAILARTPYKRFGAEEDLYGAAVFLASGKASGFVTGVTLAVDGGFLVDSI